MIHKKAGYRLTSPLPYFIIVIVLILIALGTVKFYYTERYSQVLRTTVREQGMVLLDYVASRCFIREEGVVDAALITDDRLRNCLGSPYVRVSVRIPDKYIVVTNFPPGYDFTPSFDRVSLIRVAGDSMIRIGTLRLEVQYV